MTEVPVVADEAASFFALPDVDWSVMLVVALVSLSLGLLIGWWRRGIKKQEGNSSASVPSIPIKPIYPNRVLVCLFATVAFIVAVFTVPRDMVDSAVTAYFVLLGNVVASMGKADGDS